MQLLLHSRLSNFSPVKSQKVQSRQQLSLEDYKNLLNRNGLSIFKQEIDTGALHPNGMPRKWRSCGFEGCDYRTQYKANLNRHQNHYGHKAIKSFANSETRKPLEKSDLSETNLSIVPPASSCLQDSTTNGTKGGNPEGIMEDRW